MKTRIDTLIDANMISEAKRRAGIDPLFSPERQKGTGRIDKQTKQRNDEEFHPKC